MIKIDQSFIRNLATDERLQVMTHAMITLARSLGFHVVAEGVETADALAVLRQSECDEAQGYLFARPVAAAGIRRLAGAEPGQDREASRAA